MLGDYTIGRINFGARDSFTTLGQLIDEIASQEELVDDLCLALGDFITVMEETFPEPESWWRSTLNPTTTTR